MIYQHSLGDLLVDRNLPIGRPGLGCTLISPTDSWAWLQRPPLILQRKYLVI